jgi:DNA-binding transcriptional LysR family regulator
MFDPVLLRSFALVTRTRSFSEAARRLGLGQPTVSQHIRKLEAQSGRRLFVRDTHSVTPTADGEAMVELARGVLEASERAWRYFEGSQLSGKVRFGASEDFVRSGLPALLREFNRLHPSVELELTVALSGILYQQLEAGTLDLALAKRRIGGDRGRPVWRERMIWVAREDMRLERGQPLPLASFPPPSISRAMAIEALDRARLPWRIVCNCSSLTGLHAAALAGFGFMVQPESMIPPGLVKARAGLKLPDPGEIEFVIASRGRRLDAPAGALAELIMASGRRLQAA